MGEVYFQSQSPELSKELIEIAGIIDGTVKNMKDLQVNIETMRTVLFAMFNGAALLVASAAALQYKLMRTSEFTANDNKSVGDLWESYNVQSSRVNYSLIQNVYGLENCIKISKVCVEESEKRQERMETLMKGIDIHFDEGRGSGVFIEIQKILREKSATYINTGDFSTFAAGENFIAGKIVNIALHDTQYESLFRHSSSELQNALTTLDGLLIERINETTSVQRDVLEKYKELTNNPGERGEKSDSEMMKVPVKLSNVFQEGTLVKLLASVKGLSAPLVIPKRHPTVVSDDSDSPSSEDSGSFPY